MVKIVLVKFEREIERIPVYDFCTAKTYEKSLSRPYERKLRKDTGVMKQVLVLSISKLIALVDLVNCSR